MSNFVSLFRLGGVPKELIVCLASVKDKNINTYMRFVNEPRSDMEQGMLTKILAQRRLRVVKLQDMNPDESMCALMNRGLLFVGRVYIKETVVPKR